MQRSHQVATPFAQRQRPCEAIRFLYLCVLVYEVIYICPATTPPEIFHQVKFQRQKLQCYSQPSHQGELNPTQPIREKKTKNINKRPAKRRKEGEQTLPGRVCVRFVTCLSESPNFKFGPTFQPGSRPPSMKLQFRKK